MATARGGRVRLKARILIALVISASACGVPAAPTKVSPGAVSGRQGVAVGQVVCTPAGDTRVLTPLIRARRDGVHILIRNQGNAVEFNIRVPGGMHGGPLRRRVTRSVASDPPGPAEIMCRDKGEEYPSFGDDARFVPFEIVDPDGLWVSLEPDCDPVIKAKRWFARGTPTKTVEAWVRDRFDIDVGERMQPGYPRTGWKGIPWVIADDDTTFAYFDAYPHKRGGPLLAEAKGC